MLHCKINIWIILFFCTSNLGLCTNLIADVGLVLDMESWTGKSIHSCIMMALSDFYTSNAGYRTRIVVHTRDSMGDPLRAMSNVVELLNTTKVNAIIGPETYIGSKQLAMAADRAKVPIFSFGGKSSVEYPYLFQIKDDEIAMDKSVAALVESFKWRNVIFVYENTDHGPEILQHLFESFQDKNIRITYRNGISASATNDQIIQELFKLMKVHTSVIIVHMSPLLASRLFFHAKMLGMMTKEYAWILTQKTIEIMHHPMQYEVIESLQGTLGFRSYIPMSRRLHNLTTRWHYEFSREIPMPAIWAYDTIWALGESLERAEIPQNGLMLLSELLKTKFKGVSGSFRLNERKLVPDGYEIINVIGNEERKVGYWRMSKGILQSSDDIVLHSSKGIKDVIWPGGSTTTPKGWILRPSVGKTLRIGIFTGIYFKYFVDAHYDAQKNVTTATGFSVDVFNTCIQALPYEVPYEFIPFSNGNYDYLIKKVYNQELDGILGDSSILANRSRYVDFTATYTDLGIGTLKRAKEKDLWIFLKPLDKNLWVTFAAFAFLTGLTIWAIEAMDQKSENSPSRRTGMIFWLVLLAIFFAQREKLSSNLSRFVMFVWLIVVLVLITGYTATLTSLLTVEQFEIESKGGTVGFHGRSFLGGVTISNLNFSSRKKTYYSYEDYANALSKGGKRGGADAIVDEVPYIKMFLARYSEEDYAMVSSRPVNSGFGFIFAKGSPLVADMSTEIAKLREDGTLMNLEKKWFVNETSLLNTDSSTKPKTLNLNRFGGLFIVIGVSLALALIISIGYKVRAKMEVESIISFLAGRNLMTTIRYLFT